MNEIRLYGPIGEYPGISAGEIAGQIPADAKEITVRINSPGGSVADGLAMYNYLRDHPARVTTIVDGFAASAASLVMLAGDVRQVHPGSVVMVHNPWAVAVGNSAELRQTAGALDEVTAAMMAIYENRTGLSRKELESLFADETYMRGEVALQMGFADELTPETKQQKMAAMVDFFSLCRKAKEYTPMTEATLTADPPEIADNQETIEPAAEIQMAEIVGKLSEATAALATITAERDELVGKVADLARENASQQAQIGEITAERDKLQAALANPAHIDAAMLPAAVKPSISDAEADELDRKAAEDGNPQFANIKEEYEAMEPGAARIAFWNANKKAILACE